MENFFDQYDDTGSNQQVDAQPKNYFDQYDTAEETKAESNIGVPKWGQESPNLYGVAGAAHEISKPLLQGLGLAGGAMVGVGVLNPVGGAAGGYAMAEQANQLAGEFLGVREHLTQSDRFKQLSSDVKFGAMMEMGGGIASKYIFEPVLNAGKWSFDYAKSAFTGKPGPSAMKTAGDVWKANTSTGTIYAKNRREAEMLEAEIPGLKFTEGQRTFNPKKIKFEKVAMKKQPDVGLESIEQTATNDVALKSYYQKTFGGEEGIDDFIGALNTKYGDMQKTVEAVKKAGGIIEGELAGGDVQTMHKTMIERLRLKRTIAKKEATDLYNMLDESIKIPTKTLMSEFDAIAQKKFEAEGAERIPKILGRIKKAYGKKMPEELSVMIGQFRSSGKKVPEQLLKLEAEYGAAAELPLKEIKGIRTDILNELGIENGMTKGKDHVKILRLQEMLDATERSLDQLKNSGAYGEEVANIYNAASKKWAYFRDTYDSGPVGDILQKGPRGVPFKLTPEQSLSKIFNSKDLNAADKLNIAIGKTEATKMVRQYADYDLMTKARNSVTGEIDSKSLSKWLQSNSKILNKYGLKDTYNNLSAVKSALDAAEQSIVQFEKTQAFKMLGIDSEQAVKTAFSGKGSRATAQTAKELMKIAEGNPAAQAGIKRSFVDNIVKEIQRSEKEILGSPTAGLNKFNQIYSKYEPALKEFFKTEPKKLASLKNIKKAYEIMIRNKISPLGGGKDALENIYTTLQSVAGHAPIGGPMKYRAIRSFIRVLTSFKQSQVEAVLARAIFDPEIAYTLEMMVANKIGPDIVRRRFAGHIAMMGLGIKQTKDEAMNMFNDTVQ